MQEPHNRPIYLICIFNAALNTKSLSHIAIYMSIDLKPSVLVKIYVSVDIPMTEICIYIKNLEVIYKLNTGSHLF